MRRHRGSWDSWPANHASISSFLNLQKTRRPDFMIIYFVLLYCLIKEHRVNKRFVALNRHQLSSTSRLSLHIVFRMEHTTQAAAVNDKAHHDVVAGRTLQYLSGFGAEQASEALPGALPVGQNAPQKVWKTSVNVADRLEIAALHIFIHYEWCLCFLGAVSVWSVC